MNVLTLHSAYDGCGYLRLYLPTIYNGFRTNRPSMYERANLDLEFNKQQLQWADVVVFHRAEEQTYHELAKHLKKQGKKIVMDNDDTFKLEDQHPLAGLAPDGTTVDNLKRRHDNLNEFIKLSDLITTTTKTLAEEYKKINPNVVILPNCVDPDDWDEPLRNEGDKIRIGLVGSAAFEYDYLHVKDIIRELSERDDVELVLFGLGDAKHRKQNPEVERVFKEEYAFWDTIKKEHVPWVKVYQYPETLNEARLDIMMIPRKDNYFNRCKSNVKYLEAAMCAIPVVAQSFPDGPYEEFTHNENIIKITDDSQWIPEIDRLIKDKKLREDIGFNAHMYTLKNYNIKDKYVLWKNAYDKLYENN